MADSTITDLPAAAALVGTEPVPVDQSGVTVKATAQAIADLAVNTADLATQTELDAHVNDTTAAHAASAISGLGGGAVLNVGTTGGTLAAGDDGRFTDARTPTGAAGGALAGTYPSPTLVVAYLPLSGGTLIGDLAVGTNPATTGAVRLANDGRITARNGANTLDNDMLYYTAADRLQMNAAVGIRWSVNGTIMVQVDTASFTITDGKNIAVSGTTGTKIGATAAQKLALWGATPIVQPTTAVAAATFVAGAGTTVNDASTFDGYTVPQIVKALRNIGALA